MQPLKWNYVSRFGACQPGVKTAWFPAVSQRPLLARRSCCCAGRHRASGIKRFHSPPQQIRSRWGHISALMRTCLPCPHSSTRRPVALFLRREIPFEFRQSLLPTYCQRACCVYEASSQILPSFILDKHAGGGLCMPGCAGGCGVWQRPAVSRELRAGPRCASSLRL